MASKKIQLLCFITILISTACSTRVNADGVVLSRNGQPVAGAKVIFAYSVGGKEQVVGDISTNTNSEGKFIFANTSTRHPRSQVEKITILSDSGSVTFNSGFAIGHNMTLQIK